MLSMLSSRPYRRLLYSSSHQTLPFHVLTCEGGLTLTEPAIDASEYFSSRWRSIFKHPLRLTRPTSADNAANPGPRVGGRVLTGPFRYVLQSCSNLDTILLKSPWLWENSTIWHGLYPLCKGLNVCTNALHTKSFKHFFLVTTKAKSFIKTSNHCTVRYELFRYGQSF